MAGADCKRGQQARDEVGEDGEPNHMGLFGTGVFWG